SSSARVGPGGGGGGAASASPSTRPAEPGRANTSAGGATQLTISMNARKTVASPGAAAGSRAPAAAGGAAGAGRGAPLRDARAVGGDGGAVPGRELRLGHRIPDLHKLACVAVEVLAHRVAKTRRVLEPERDAARERRVRAGPGVGHKRNSEHTWPAARAQTAVA